MKRARIALLSIAIQISMLVNGLAQDVSLALQRPDRPDSTAVAALWNQQPSGAVVGFGSGSIRYQRDIPLARTPDQNWHSAAWKNEKIHTQLLISTRTNLDKVTVTVGDLSDDQGHKIPGDRISLGYVQYVMTDEFRNGCGHRKPQDFDSSLVADIINTDINSIPVSKNTVQAVWLSVKVPKNAIAGNYTGTVTVHAGQPYELQIALTVLDRTLPSPGDWSFRLDYWQHPAAVARVHDVPLWSDAHFELLSRYYTMLAQAGQKIITASIVEEPWGHQTYDDYPSLITWIKKKNGSWEYDYSLFDKYIAFVMRCGIRSQINCYSMVPWKIAFSYYDESLQKDTVFTGAIGTPSYNAFWRNMLTDFTRHLKEKGWFDITTIAMDERPMKAMKSVIDLLGTIDPNWKISLAGDYHQEIEASVYDYCIASRWAFPDRILQKRAALGKISTWYVCCTEKYPNMFTFSPPDEAVWAGWYTAATGMNGLLRWAYNSWPQTPLTDSRFTSWPAGDTYQVYPGPLTSIRFEKLIEGIQDFEKIQYLRQQYKRQGAISKLRILETALKEFQIEGLAKVSAAEMVARNKGLLNQ
ncbi:DUF4091 domain-containing protein [Niabella terrae]